MENFNISIYDNFGKSLDNITIVLNNEFKQKKLYYENI